MSKRLVRYLVLITGKHLPEQEFVASVFRSRDAACERMQQLAAANPSRAFRVARMVETPEEEER